MNSLEQAAVVELVDTHGSGPCDLTVMRVRVSPAAYRARPRQTRQAKGAGPAYGSPRQTTTNVSPHDRVTGRCSPIKLRLEKFIPRIIVLALSMSRRLALILNQSVSSEARRASPFRYGCKTTNSAPQRSVADARITPA